MLDTINTKFTFENFIVGDNNILAFDACKRMLEDIPDSLNPVFIYGATGMGKTHLLHSIANSCLLNNPELKVVYISAESFVKEFVSCCNDTEIFSDKYSTADILLIDDLQYLENKTVSQHFFTKIVSDIKNAGGQLVFSSDKPVGDLIGFNEKLISRLKSCICAEIEKPAIETRKFILKKFCEDKKLELSDDVFCYIAENITDSVRDLKSCVKRLSAYADLRGKSMNLCNAEKILSDFF